MSQKWMTLEELRKNHPHIFKRWMREKKMSTLFVYDKYGNPHHFIGRDWQNGSSYNVIKNVVVCDDDGNPAYEIPGVWVRRGCTTIVWGRDRNTDEVKIGIIYQPRPIANEPPDTKEDRCLTPNTIEYIEDLFAGRAQNPVVFAQTPGGLRNIDPTSGKLESPDDTARSEAREESGVGDDAIIEVTSPSAPFWNSDPGVFADWHDIRFVEVDLEKVRSPQPDKTESIYKVVYLSVQELLAHIAQGAVPVLIDGEEQRVYYRAGSSLAVLMIFFSSHPEFLLKNGTA